jgi:hypothetical protein
MKARILAATLIASFLAAGPAAAADAICGDVNQTGTVTTGDALAVLRKSVGQNVTLVCPPTGGIQVTGQTVCFDSAGTPINCTDSGQDGELQLGVARAFTDNGNGTVTDEVTGLVWEKLSDDGSIHDKDTTYSWAGAFSSKIATLNMEAFAGHSDWRVPNRFELDSLVNLGASGPATYSSFAQSCTGGCTILACSCTRPDYYWSASSYLASPVYGWTVYFNAGDTYAQNKSQSYFVRAVRGGS